MDHITNVSDGLWTNINIGNRMMCNRMVNKTLVGACGDRPCANVLLIQYIRA